MMRDRGDRAADSTSATGEPATRIGPGDFALPKSAAIAHLLSLLPRARLTLKHNFALAFHAGNLALATVANGILGFVYWWVTARAFTPTNVGLASADISLMVLLATAADLGLGTMLQGEIPRHKRLSPHITSAALLGALASGSALGLTYLALAAVFGPNFGTSAGIPSTRVLVVVGIGLQTFSLVLDAALIGMLSAPLRLFRNLLFAAGKLLLITIAGALVIPEDWQLDAIIASWVIGQAAAALGLASVVWLRGARIWYRPRFDTLGQLVGVAFWHHLVNVVAMAPSLVLPIIIAALLSPEQNAPFYAAWMLLSLAGVVPAALANVLFTLGSGASSRALSGLRFSLSVSLGVGAVAAVGFWLLSNVALNMLNPVYSDLVGSDLRFLGLSVPLMAVKVHYMTVQRIERRLRQAAVVLGGFGAVEILFAALGAEFHGLLGAMAGWLIAMGLEAACLWPTLRRQLRDDVGEGGRRSNLEPRSMWCGLGSRSRPSVKFLSCEWLLTLDRRRTVITRSGRPGDDLADGWHGPLQIQGGMDDA
jgi:O-antigen/teichoic acid export membrane protein